jgi:hypothetical protein
MKTTVLTVDKDNRQKPQNVKIKTEHNPLGRHIAYREHTRNRKSENLLKVPVKA